MTAHALRARVTDLPDSRRTCARRRPGPKGRSEHSPGVHSWALPGRIVSVPTGWMNRCALSVVPTALSVSGCRIPSTERAGPCSHRASGRNDARWGLHPRQRGINDHARASAAPQAGALPPRPTGQSVLAHNFAKQLPVHAMAPSQESYRTGHAGVWPGRKCATHPEHVLQGNPVRKALLPEGQDVHPAGKNDPRQDANFHAPDHASKEQVTPIPMAHRKHPRTPHGPAQHAADRPEDDARPIDQRSAQGPDQSSG